MNSQAFRNHQFNGLQRLELLTEGQIFTSIGAGKGSHEKELLEVVDSLAKVHILEGTFMRSAFKHLRRGIQYIEFLWQNAIIPTFIELNNP